MQRRYDAGAGRTADIRTYRRSTPPTRAQGGNVSVAKHVEITADSKKSFEDAVEKGIEKAAESLKGIKSAWVKDQQVLVEDDKVKKYRVNMVLTFVLE
jgi:hypothetical protein